MKTVVDAVNELEGDLQNTKPFGSGSFVCVCISNAGDAVVGDYALTGGRHCTDSWREVCTAEEFNQCAAEMSEAKWIPESKPVFTQAMQESGLSVQVGMVFTAEVGKDYCAVMINDKSVCFEDEDGFLVGMPIGRAKPIKTEREKAVESALSKIVVPVNIDAVKMVLGATFDADLLKCQNYRKLTPLQAKAYDDKTEYFGEDYK